MPVNNKELTYNWQKIKKQFYIAVHVPVFILKILLGEMSVEILKSATVSAHKIRAAGFKFLYPSIDAALTDLVKNKKLNSGLVAQVSDTTKFHAYSKAGKKEKSQIVGLKLSFADEKNKG